jgi:uncharacterized protein YkwD
MRLPLVLSLAFALNAGLLLGGPPAGSIGASSGAGYLPIADCGIAPQDTHPWYANGLLDQAAKAWAHGAKLNAAVEHSGYTATAVSGLHFYGLDAPERPRLSASNCRILRDRSLTDLGVYTRGDDVWVVFAARTVLPNSQSAGGMDQRAVELVNAARAQGHRCGNRLWPQVHPVQLSAQLAEIARQHALDMARHHYFDHQDSSGRSPADRVRAAGYREQRVGENLAYGTLSTEDAIAGWLASPAHCENLMDAHFKEMGIAFVPDPGDARNLYWVQLFAEPK